MLDSTYNTPLYPTLGPTVARLRRSADRHAHGTAVLDAIRALQARELAGALEPAARPNCASGTAATDGDGILAAIRRSQAAALAGTRGPARTPEQLATAYAEAMAAKRAAGLFQAAAPTCSPPVDGPSALRAKPSTRRVRTKPMKSCPPRPAPIPPAYSLPRILGAVGVSFC